MKLDMQKVQSTDWTQMHITSRAVVFDGVTYSLRTSLKAKVKIADDPTSNKNDDILESNIDILEDEKEKEAVANETNEPDADAEEEEEDEEVVYGKWEVSNISSMSLTSN